VSARADKSDDTSGDIGNGTSDSTALSIYQAPVAAATTHDVVVKLTHNRAHFSCWNDDQDSIVHATDIYSSDEQNGDHSDDIEMIVKNITEVRKSTIDHMIDYCLAWQRKRLRRRTVVASYVPIYQMATLPVRPTFYDKGIVVQCLSCSCAFNYHCDTQVFSGVLPYLHRCLKHVLMPVKAVIALRYSTMVSWQQLLNHIGSCMVEHSKLLH
jgi:hypothetical protein